MHKEEKVQITFYLTVGKLHFFCSPTVGKNDFFLLCFLEATKIATAAKKCVTHFEFRMQSVSIFGA